METTGTIEDALRQAEHLLAAQPRLAVAQARAILDATPDHPHALLVLGTAWSRLGNVAAARAVLEPLARAQPRAARVHLEWGMVQVALGQNRHAVAALRHAVALKPDLPQAWRALGDLLILEGRTVEADAAYAAHLRASVNDPALMQPAIALCEGNLPVAERLLRAHLKQAPTDVAAIRMLAEAATRLGRYGAAEHLLERCLELAPGFTGARHNYAVVLYRQNRAVEAVPHIERLVAEEPHEPNYRNLLAAVLASTGEYDRAIELYAGLAAKFPGQPRILLGHGHALRTAGRREEAVAAYRACLAHAPSMGEAWWSLANLKIAVLDAADETSMRAALVQEAGQEAISLEDRYHLHYALGRTAEEAGRFAESFAEYAEGARLRRTDVSYDAGATTAQVAQTIALFTPAFITARAGFGCPDAAPIFVIGLPRSGSTLLEQMLASHPLVEGTMELPELANVAREMAEASTYPACLAAIAPDALAGWGARYLERARIYRKSEKPFFIDKLPNNWLHAGLIHLILPRAKIIDARRHPMATCFSAFKQHFARGQNYSYDQIELGRFYNDYLALMAHLDDVLPGRIHRVTYERMVEDTEAELRHVLDYCGLAFDPACLRFHENTRAVRTASSEQVRQPIFRDGLDQWRNYEPWLGPLAATLANA